MPDLMPDLKKVVPSDGWSVSLIRNSFLGEHVPPLPKSNKIVTLDKAKSNDGDEYHFIVHCVSPVLDESFAKAGVTPGMRVTISGRPTPLSINGRDFFVVDFGNIRTVLTRKDGALWYGSRGQIDL